MSNISQDIERYQTLDWSIAEKELGYNKGDIINIGWHCSDRICEKGDGGKIALLWEDHQGNEKQYTYNDLRILSNSIAKYLVDLQIKPGERVCLFMDRVPELYIGFISILKMGGVAQPLFSAFGDESLFTRLDNAKTTAIITQRKHVAKVRKIRDQLPELRHIIIVDAGDYPLKEREIS